MPLLGFIHVYVRTLVQRRIVSTLPWVHVPRRNRRVLGPLPASVAIDPVRPNEHGGPALLAHDSVELIPVVMLAAGS